MKDTNNIENSFRDRFDSNSIQNEGWNNPRGIVWEKIEEKIFDKKRNRFGFLPFILVSFLAMTLISTFYLYSQNLELKNVIEKASTNKEANITSKEPHASSLLVVPKEGQAESANFINKTQNEIANSSIGFDNNIVSNNTPIDKLINSKSGKVKKKMITSPMEVSNVKSTLANGLEEGSNNFKNENTSYNYEVINSNISLQREVQGVSSLASINNYLDYEREVNSPKIILLKKEEEVRRPYLSFLPNIAVGLLQTKGSQETALTELIDKEYGNTGVGFDFLYTIPINKSIDVSMGLGIESTNFSTEYDITLPYMTEDETVDGEKAYIDFEHSLPTAFGNTDTALRLSRKRASDVLNESNVNLDFNTQHNFVSLALPIGLKYRFGSNKSFFNLGLSARPTYILNANSSIQSVISHHSGIDAINNESISTYSNVRKLNVGLGVEIGYNMFLTEKSGLNINLSLHDYLFDFYQVNDFSSSVRKAGISIGYLHAF